MSRIIIDILPPQFVQYPILREPENIRQLPIDLLMAAWRELPECSVGRRILESAGHYLLGDLRPGNTVERWWRDGVPIN